MVRIAVLITVFNRRETTLKGLESLYASIAYLGDGYHFDVFLTDDGCSDGTAEAVSNKFPDVRIVKGNGDLFWGGGMNLAWKTAVETRVEYDYYLWYNDDSDLFPDALQTMFDNIANDVVVTGAFRGNNGKVSYGGRTKKDQLISPNGMPQDVVKMNGNLVLIPSGVFQTVGLIDKHYIHAGGDFDYGFRAREKGFRVQLTPHYIGIANRHSEFIPKYCNKEFPLSKRWKMLHTPIYSPRIHFRLNMLRESLPKAILYFIIAYIGVLFPSLYVKIKSAYKGE